MAGRGDAHFAGAIEVSPSLAYIEQAYLDAKQLGWAQRPVISMQVPTTQDNSLAPEGAHVASLFCQHFQRHLPNGQNWDDVREKVADQIIATIDAYAPNFKASVLGRQIKTPLDIERDLGMIGGDIFHGALQLDQFYSHAPHTGPCVLPDARRQCFLVWLWCASRRRRHRVARPQRRAGHVAGPVSLR